MKIDLDKSDIELIQLAIDLSLNGINKVIAIQKNNNTYDTLTYLSTKLIVLKSYLNKKR